VTGVVDVFDILRPVLSRGSLHVHLAPLDWEERSNIATLCGRAIERGRTSMSFARSGCLSCARRAVGAGITGFRETPHLVVNLDRFIDDRPFLAQRTARRHETRKRSRST
jgi:hypothetical protein